MRDRARRGLAIGALVAAALLSCGSVGIAAARSPSESTPHLHAGLSTTIPSGGPIRPSSCPVGAPQDPATHGFECGVLTVPQRHADPGGPTLQLAVAVVHAGDSSTTLPPIVYLTGGPGSSALLEIGFLAGSSLRAHRDIVLFDQRGAGFSKPSLACPELVPGPDERAPTDEALPLLARQVAACRTRLTNEGIDLAAYTTNENAADVEALRLALGIRQWDLYGISYGTRLALEVMRDFPGGVRSVVLDSAYPPQVRSFEDRGARLDRAFEAVVGACRSDPSCARFYPDLGVRFGSVIDSLEADRYQFKPDSVPGHTIESAFRGWFYDTLLLPALPGLIHSVDIGNTAPFLQAFDQPIPVSETDSQGMNFSIECAERASMADPAAVAADAAAHPRWRALLARDTAATACASWGVPSARPEDLAAVDSPIPTLIFSGTFDPVTPPAYAALTASTLSRSQVVEVPRFGHAVTMISCPAGIRDAFFDDPARPPDTSCVGGIASSGGAFITDQVANAGLGRMYHRLLFGLNGPTLGHWILFGFAGLVFALTTAVWGSRAARWALRRGSRRSSGGPVDGVASSGAALAEGPRRVIAIGRLVAVAAIAADLVFVVGLAVVIVGQPEAMTRDLGLPVAAAWLIGVAALGFVLGAALAVVAATVVVGRLGRRRTRLHLSALAVACLIVSGTLFHYGVIFA